MRTTTWACAMPAASKRTQAAVGRNFFIGASPYVADWLGRSICAAGKLLSEIAEISIS